MVARLFVPVLLLIFFSVSHFSQTGCSGKEINESDPASVYNDAEEDIENDRFQLALDKLRKVKNKFPYLSGTTLTGG